MKIIIEVNETQANIIKEALDLYSRILAGQLEEIEYTLRKYYYKHLDPEDRRKVETLMKEYKLCMFDWILQSTNESIGISNEELHDNAKVAYDIIQVLRNKISWFKQPEGDILCSFDKPIKFGSHELCKVSVKDEENG